jgi:hypothetical protein
MKNELNSLELLIVEADLARKGVKDYKVRGGNDCIWVSYDQINAYYVFNSKCELVDLQFD